MSGPRRSRATRPRSSRVQALDTFCRRCSVWDCWGLLPYSQERSRRSIVDLRRTREPRLLRGINHSGLRPSLREISACRSGRQPTGFAATVRPPSAHHRRRWRWSSRCPLQAPCGARCALPDFCRARGRLRPPPWISGKASLGCDPGLYRPHRPPGTVPDTRTAPILAAGTHISPSRSRECAPP